MSETLEFMEMERMEVVHSVSVDCLKMVIGYDGTFLFPIEWLTLTDYAHGIMTNLYTKLCRGERVSLGVGFRSMGDHVVVGVRSCWGAVYRM